MAVGVRIRNGSGGIQIDETYKNLALRAKGTLVPATSWNGGKWRLGSITVTGNSPVLAWRSASPVAMTSSSRSGSSVTYNFIMAATDGSIDWFLFDEPVYGSAQGSVGLRIRNPTTGVVVFDSRMKYMRIVGAVSGDFSSLNPPANGSYAGSPAIVTGNSPYNYIVQTIGAPGGAPPYPWMELIMFPMASISGGQVTWVRKDSDAISHQANETVLSSGSQYAYNYLVIDVANF